MGGSRRWMLPFREAVKIVNWRRALGRDLIINSVGGSLIFIAGDVIAQKLAHNRQLRPADDVAPKGCGVLDGLSPSNNVLGASKDHQDGTSSSDNSTVILGWKSPEWWMWRRSLAMGGQGCLLNGVFLTPFYHLLDAAIGDTRGKGKFWPGIPLKILWVQGLFMPLSTIFFLGFTPTFHHWTGHQRIDSAVDGPLWSAAKRGWDEVNSHFRVVYVVSWWFWPISDVINFRFIPVNYRPLWDSAVDVIWTTYLSFKIHPVEKDTPQHKSIWDTLAAPFDSSQCGVPGQMPESVCESAGMKMSREEEKKGRNRS